MTNWKVLEILEKWFQFDNKGYHWTCSYYFSLCLPWGLYTGTMFISFTTLDIFVWTHPESCGKWQRGESIQYGMYMHLHAIIIIINIMLVILLTDHCSMTEVKRTFINKGNHIIIIHHEAVSLPSGHGEALHCFDEVYAHDAGRWKMEVWKMFSVHSFTITSMPSLPPSHKLLFCQILWQKVVYSMSYSKAVQSH